MPKTVMCMLVNRVKDEIASELVHNLYSSITGVDSLLKGSCTPLLSPPPHPAPAAR